MIRLTGDQRLAVETLGGSVIVTASAGSGKTAVLAERCAHLVCDLPPGRRCGVDELLVVTFTEAAAAEMKGRILQAIRQRLRGNPNDAYLRTQAALIDTARISTLHSFCLWMLRRWFSEASVDPTAAVLAEDEARLLRAETIEELFSELYAADTPLGRDFVRLVDHYGLGSDTTIADAVSKLDAFLRSLPDPAGWLASARDAVGSGAGATIAAAEQELRAELSKQAAYVEGTAALIEAEYPVGQRYAQLLREYAAALAGWQEMPDLDAVCAAVRGFKLDARRGARLPRDAPESDKAQWETAKELFEKTRDVLLTRRLKRWVRFSREEMLAGLGAIRPYVDTLCQLVTAFGQRYQRAKKDLDALDFADLERGAYELLGGAGGADGLPSRDREGADMGDPPGPSAVARDLQARFAHVLVDEVQDINPLQAAILHRVSRESDAAGQNNLFCVGDVKQSIYRFRLAEPELFQRRIDTAGDGSTCVRLQENFRSAGVLLDGINLLFERLMTREVGGVDYDEKTRLKAGRSDADEAGAPIELHLLERRVEPAAPDDDEGEQRLADPDDPAQWQSIEREACLIGQRIHELRAAGMTVDGRPLAWGDVAVLLRAARHTAQPLADVLARMGIPAVADAGEALLAATEVRDVLALLHVLDNPQQDIPLASVLRSGVTGMALNEDDLVAIRCYDREVPFHEAARRYAEAGSDESTQRLAAVFMRIHRWRGEARRRPLAETLWKIYRESGYLAYVGGLPQGRFRRANLLALHERARQFGGFRRQGLHRFLRFIELLEGSDQELAGARPLGQAQEAVQIMTIHRSKGLEFPVVFVGDLGHRFNLSDARGRVIFDRKVGVGLRVVEPERMIEYPTVQHARVARAIEAAARDEELRILYVALTRARERLILVGSTDLGQVEQTRSLWGGLGRSGVSPSSLPAGTPLEWIVPSLAAAEAVAWQDQPQAPRTDPVPSRNRMRADVTELWRVAVHAEDDMREWRIEAEAAAAENRALATVGALEPLPPDEPRSAASAEARAVLDRLDYAYPHLAASSVRAVLGASEAKRVTDPWADEHQPTGQPHYQPRFDPPAVLGGEAVTITGQQRGTVTHRVLEQVDWSNPPAAELARLVTAGLVTPAEADAVDGGALEWFAGTPLGRRVRAAGANYRREFTFISAEPAWLFDPGLEGTCADRVLVRGIVDGLLPGDGGLEVIDFKTDAVEADMLARRAETYAMQMRLYARATARVWRQPVARCWLVFLRPRRIIEVPQEVGP